MSTFSIFLILIVIVAFLLVVVIMVQNQKVVGFSTALGGVVANNWEALKKRLIF